MINKTREGMENMSKEEETIKITKQILKKRQIEFVGIKIK